MKQGLGCLKGLKYFGGIPLKLKKSQTSLQQGREERRMATGTGDEDFRLDLDVLVETEECVPESAQ